MRSARRLRLLGVGLLFCMPLLLAPSPSGGWGRPEPDDPIFAGDPVGPDNKPIPLVPFAPGLDPGPDEEFGTRDDIVLDDLRGDVDLKVVTAVRKAEFSRVHGKSGRRVPVAVAEPFGEGEPISFFLAPTDGSPSAPGGNPIHSPALADNMVLGAVFADLDGDGYIGITNLDGNPADGAIEVHELTPVGRRLAPMSGGSFAHGEVYVSAGGPPGAELDLVVGAMSITGDLDPERDDFFIPDGTPVMTQMPFFPNLVTRYAVGGLPDPNGLFGLEFEAGLEPDPNDPKVGEQFTLTTDDSGLTTGSAISRSGAFARIGFGRRVLSAEGIGAHDLLRPTRWYSGSRVLYQILDHLSLSPDGDASVEVLQVLPLDRLGNVTEIGQPTTLTLTSRGSVNIIWPDNDGDPKRERVYLLGSLGTPVVIDDDGGVGGGGRGLLVAEMSGVFSRLDISLPSLDFDGSGSIDAQDIDVVRAGGGARRGDRDYDPALDLNRDGRIDATDVEIVTAHLRRLGI